MNLPFSLPSPKDAGGKKREELQEVTAAYERRLAEYQDTLEIYKKWLSEYSGSKAGTRIASEQSPMNIQAALDLTYLKEQGEKEIALMNELSKDAVGRVLSELELIKVNQAYAGEQLEGLDRNVVNRISELLIELQKQSHTQSQAELTGQVERLEGKLRKNQTLLWFLFVFNLISVSGIAFLILYILELLPY